MKVLLTKRWINTARLTRHSASAKRITHIGHQHGATTLMIACADRFAILKPSGGTLTLTGRKK
jgi:hypothetical protein